MTDYTTNDVTTSLTPLADIVRLKATIDALKLSVVDLTNERDEARVQRDKALNDQRVLRGSLQESLADFAENHLDSSDESYSDLNQIMQDHGLEGLKRTFNVTVRVTYEFEVEVEAASEDEARDLVDNDITTHTHENVSMYDYPDDYDIEVEEA